MKKFKLTPEEKNDTPVYFCKICGTPITSNCAFDIREYLGIGVEKLSELIREELPVVQDCFFTASKKELTAWLAEKERKEAGQKKTQAETSKKTILVNQAEGCQPECSRDCIHMREYGTLNRGCAIHYGYLTRINDRLVILPGMNCHARHGKWEEATVKQPEPQKQVETKIISITIRGDQRPDGIICCGDNCHYRAGERECLNGWSRMMRFADTSVMVANSFCPLWHRLYPTDPSR
jgi:hypothetical protein